MLWERSFWRCEMILITHCLIVILNPPRISVHYIVSTFKFASHKILMDFCSFNLVWKPCGGKMIQYEIFKVDLHLGYMKPNRGRGMKYLPTGYSIRIWSINCMLVACGNRAERLHHRWLSIFLPSEWSCISYLIWGFPKMVVPPKHPKIIICIRKTHGCWAPPF